jgi:hypothetical protein
MTWRGSLAEAMSAALQVAEAWVVESVRHHSQSQSSENWIAEKE